MYLCSPLALFYIYFPFIRLDPHSFGVTDYSPPFSPIFKRLLSSPPNITLGENINQMLFIRAIQQFMTASGIFMTVVMERVKCIMAFIFNIILWHLVLYYTNLSMHYTCRQVHAQVSGFWIPKGISFLNILPPNFHLTFMVALHYLLWT